MARGVWDRPRSFALSDWELDEMLSKVAAGMKPKLAADAYGVSVRTVYRHMRRREEGRGSAARV